MRRGFPLWTGCPSVASTSRTAFSGDRRSPRRPSAGHSSRGIGIVRKPQSDPLSCPSFLFHDFDLAASPSMQLRHTPSAPYAPQAQGAICASINAHAVKHRQVIIADVRIGLKRPSPKGCSRGSHTH